MQSAAKTGRVLISHEAPLTMGFAAEIAATIQVKDLSSYSLMDTCICISLSLSLSLSQCSSLYYEVYYIHGRFSIPFYHIFFGSRSPCMFLRELIFVGFNDFHSLECRCTVIRHHRPQWPTHFMNCMLDLSGSCSKLGSVI